MKAGLLFIVLLALSTISYSQSLTHRVIASGGSYSESQNFKLSYSVGEAFVSQLQSSSTKLYPGFQQSWNLSVGLDDITGNIKITAYPNPVREMLTIRFSDIDQDFLYIDIFSLKGDILLSKKIEGPFTGRSESFNVSNLGTGLLILKIRSGDNKSLITVPIVKN